jgi:hypothetical protein
MPIKHHPCKDIKALPVIAATHFLASIVGNEYFRISISDFVCRPSILNPEIM